MRHKNSAAQNYLIALVDLTSLTLLMCDLDKHHLAIAHFPSLIGYQSSWPTGHTQPDHFAHLRLLQESQSSSSVLSILKKSQFKVTLLVNCFPKVYPLSALPSGFYCVVCTLLPCKTVAPTSTSTPHSPLGPWYIVYIDHFLKLVHRNKN